MIFMPGIRRHGSEKKGVEEDSEVALWPAHVQTRGTIDRFLATDHNVPSMLLSVFRLSSRKRNTFRYFSCSARKEKKFDVLFLGRDEFSCRVFNSLYGADGECSALLDSCLILRL